MRVVTIMLLVLATSCGQEEPELDKPIDICSDDLGFVDSDTKFGATINKETWKPNFSTFATYYGKKLFINATDLGVLEGIWRTLDIRIDNPVVGRNDVSYSSSHFLSLRQIENRFGFTGFVSCGFVNLTRLDTINSVISGTFQGVIKVPDDNSEITITNGIFNDLALANLFCEPNYLYEVSNTNLFADWEVIGVYNSQGSAITFPPCNSINTLTFNSSTQRVTGSNGGDGYWADFIKISDSQISISPIGSYRGGSGKDHEFYFQQTYFDVISNSELNYEIKNNLLTLTNSKSGKMVKLFLKI